MNVIGVGQTESPLSHEQIEQVIAQAAEQLGAAGKRVLAIVPDHTRTCPLPLVMRLLHKHLRPRAAKLDAIIALGSQRLP